jgi:CheY-like chemotaxis protein
MNTVLLVEDDMTALALLKGMVERAGCRTVTARDVEAAWQGLVAHSAVDLAIVDLQLPGSSGVDWLRRLRADPLYAGLPVVLCSASPDRNAVVEAAKLGVSNFLLKPFQAVRIAAEIEKAVAKRWLRAHFGDVSAHVARLGFDRELWVRLAGECVALAAAAYDEKAGPAERQGAREEAVTAAEQLGLSVVLKALASPDGLGATVLRRGEELRRLAAGAAAR